MPVGFLAALTDAMQGKGACILMHGGECDPSLLHRGADTLDAAGHTVSAVQKQRGDCRGSAGFFLIIERSVGTGP